MCAPDSFRSFLHRRSLLPLSFSTLQSRITLYPASSSLSPSPRDAHYRNVSVTAVKNVNSWYRRHCPVDAKCPLAGNTDRRFRPWCCYSRSSSLWGESCIARRPWARIYPVNLDLIYPGLLRYSYRNVIGMWGAYFLMCLFFLSSTIIPVLH